MKLNPCHGQRPTKVGDSGIYIHDYCSTWFKNYSQAVISEEMLNPDRPYLNDIPSILLNTLGLATNSSEFHNKYWVVVAQCEGNLTILYQHDSIYYLFHVPAEVEDVGKYIPEKDDSNETVELRGTNHYKGYHHDQL